MKILISGSMGVIGTKLMEIFTNKCKQFSADFPVPYGIDLFHAENEKGWVHPMGEIGGYSRCDIADFRQLERVIDFVRPDIIYNTAAEFGRWNGEDYYEQLWRTNAIGTKNIIRLQEKYGFKLIHFSSSEVYGDYPGTMFESVMDKKEIKQLNDYAISKWVNEMQIRNSIREYGTHTVIVRLFNTYGPGEWYHAYRSVNSKFCYSALKGYPITVYKGHTRTSTYLDDTCRTLSNIVDNFKSGEVYNIGGFHRHTMEELADIVWEVTGANRNLITYKEAEISTTKDKKVNSDKAVKDLDHKITVDLKEGIQNTVNWLKEYYKI